MSDSPLHPLIVSLLKEVQEAGKGASIATDKLLKLRNNLAETVPQDATLCSELVAVWHAFDSQGVEPLASQLREIVAQAPEWRGAAAEYLENSRRAIAAQFARPQSLGTNQPMAGVGLRKPR